MSVSILTPTAAVAGEVARKPTCPKIESPRQPTQQQLQQQRQRVQECRIAKPVPPLFDPAPFFLL